MRNCIKCGDSKTLSEFYKHKGMSDGYFKKCKECVKTGVKNRYKENSKNPEWVEKERARGRNKYHRLNYKENERGQLKKYPWKSTSTYKNLSRDHKLPVGIEHHHWCYHDEYLADTFHLSASNHAVVHSAIKLDVEKRIFITNDGILLDTKTKHKLHIEKILQITINNQG